MKIRAFAAVLQLIVPPLLLHGVPLDSVQNVEAIIVNAPLRHSTSEPQRLAGTQLTALRSRSAADAIRQFAGVQVKDYGGIGGLKTIDIRSMGSAYTAVFYDGIAIGNAQNNTIDLGRFSMENVEEIALYSSGKSTNLQTAKEHSAAASIYLKARRPTFKDSSNYNLTAGARIGSFDMLGANVLLERKVNSAIAAQVSADYVQASGRYQFKRQRRGTDGSIEWDTTATRENGDLHAIRTEASLHGAAPQLTWNIRTYYYNSQRGIPGAIVSNVWHRAERQWDMNLFAQAQAHYTPSTKYELLFNIKYARDYLRYLNDDTIYMYIDNRYLQQELYGSIAAAFHNILPHTDLSCAADYQFNALEMTIRNSASATRSSVLGTIAISSVYKNIKAQAALNLNSHADNGISTNAGTYYSPSVFIVYSIRNTGVSTRAAYKRVRRLPTFNDLYYTDVGASNLQSECANQYSTEASYNTTISVVRQLTFGINAAAYYYDITNKIVATPRGSGQFRWRMTNIGAVRTYGVDLTTKFGWQPLQRSSVGVTINYSYQKALDYSTNSSYTHGEQIPYSPLHSGSVAATITCYAWMLNYTFIYAGERWTSSANLPENHLQPWYTHDAAISVLLRLYKVKCRIGMQVNNMLNQYYDVVRNYPMPGRNYLFTIRAEL